MRTLIALLFLLGNLWTMRAEDLTRYVNPLMGTLSTFELSAGLSGHSAPVGHELLDTSDGKNGRWMAICIYRQPDTGF